MPAEGMPQAEPSLLSRPLVWCTQGAIRFPLLTLILGAAAAAASLYLSQTQLKFHTSRDDVLSPTSDYNRRWLQYAEEFTDKQDVVVAVEGDGEQAIVPVLEEVAAAVEREPWLFQDVLYKIDLTGIRAKGLYYLPLRELATIEGTLSQMAPVLQGDWSQLTIGGMAAASSSAIGAGPAPGRMAVAGPPASGTLATAAHESYGRFFTGLVCALSGQGPYQSPWPKMDLPVDPEHLTSKYLLADGGRFGFVLMRFAEKDDQSFAQNTAGVDTLREIIARAAAHFPNVRIGLTGLPVMENDEMRQSQSWMTLVTFVSLGGVFVVLVAGFGNLRHSVMPTVALLLGTIWTLGYTALAVGHLNILSIAFGSILMGEGINYGIYYLARYQQLCRTSASNTEALLSTAASIGPSVTMGAVAAASAFFAASFCDFPGVAQLGIIAGGGILLCWLAAMTILPALIKLFDARRFGEGPPPALDIYGSLKPLYAFPRLSLAATIVVTVLLAVGIGKLRFDDNLLDLQPTGLESVEWERRLTSEIKQSVWYGLSVANTPEQALQRKAAFERLPSVERVEEIASMLPPQVAEKRPLIERIYSRLRNLPQEVPALPVVPPEQLARVLAGAQQSLLTTASPEQGPQGLSQIAEMLRRLPPQEFYRRLSTYQQQVAADLLNRFYLLRSVSNPEPPKLADLPNSLITRFVGRHGKFLLQVYGKGDIWKTEAAERFVLDVRQVDPEITGNPLQVYEATRHMKRSYEQTALYALAVIVALLWFEFGNFRYPLLAMLPLGAGMLQLFGLMGLLDIPLNSANMIVLPLLIGLGAENGIHIIDDYRRRKDSYRRMSPATTTTIIIDSLTTMVGFAALIIASHRGLQSLGRVLTLGMGCCLMSALVLPNLPLLWRRRSEDCQSLAESAGADDGEPGEHSLGEDFWPAQPQSVAARRHWDAAA